MTEDNEHSRLQRALKDLLGMVTLNLSPAQIGFLPGMKQAVVAAQEALRGRN